MPRENSIHDLRNNRVVIANDAWKYRSGRAKPGDEVVAQLIFYATAPQTLFGKRTLPQLAQSARKTHDGDPHYYSEGDYTLRSCLPRYWTLGQVDEDIRSKIPVSGGQSMRVAVAAGFLTNLNGAAQGRQDTFEIFDHGLNTARF